MGFAVPYHQPVFTLAVSGCQINFFSTAILLSTMPRSKRPSFASGYGGGSRLSETDKKLLRGGGGGGAMVLVVFPSAINPKICFFAAGELGEVAIALRNTIGQYFLHLASEIKVSVMGLRNGAYQFVGCSVFQQVPLHAFLIIWLMILGSL